MCIYVLREPFGEQRIRYVGKTTQEARKRLAGHLHAANKKNSDGTFRYHTHLHNWLRCLATDGFAPTMEIVALGRTNEELADLERFYIAQYRFAGLELVNHTEGGEGCIGYKHTPEARKKMSERQKGRPSFVKGRKSTIESRLLISKTKTGMSSHQQLEALEWYRKGETTYKVAERFGVSPTCITGLVKIFGEHVRDMSESRIKIRDEAQRQQIKELYLEGYSAPMIAPKFGVSEVTIRRILKDLGVILRDIGQSNLMADRIRAQGVSND